MGPQGPSGAAGTVGPKVNILSDNSKHFCCHTGQFFLSPHIVKGRQLFGGERRAKEKGH